MTRGGIAFEKNNNSCSNWHWSDKLLPENVQREGAGEATARSEWRFCWCNDDHKNMPNKTQANSIMVVSEATQSIAVYFEILCRRGRRGEGNKPRISLSGSNPSNQPAKQFSRSRTMLLHWVECLTKHGSFISSLKLLGSGWPSLLLAFTGYTIRAAREMNDIVFSSSCLQPLSLVVREVLTDHTYSLVTSWMGHLCRICSVVWSSWLQRQVAEDANFSLRCIRLFSLLCPVRSLTRMTCCSRDSRW